MPSPAGRPQRPRTVIQWHDSGPKPRVRHFLPDDASPYRALLLAGSMAVVSIAAVVAGIQYQRHGSLPEVGALVEPAAASPETVADLAWPAKLKTDVVKPVQANVVTRAVPQPAAPAATAEPIMAAEAPSTKASRIETEAVATKAVEAAQPESGAPDGYAEDRLALAAAADAADAADANNPAAALEQFETPQNAEAVETGGALAFAPTEAAAGSPPLPQAAPRDTQVAAVATKPEEPEAADTGESATVRSAVNLRAGPSDGAKVLLTIPRGAKVQTSGGCRHWCPVTYDGRSGFVYKSFIRR